MASDYGGLDIDEMGRVIDEAGQCHPAFAVSALARADRALIIGDVHQLEPVIGLDDSEEAAPATGMKLALPDGLLCALLVAPILVFGLLWWGGLVDWATMVARDLPYVLGAGR